MKGCVAGERRTQGTLETSADEEIMMAMHERDDEVRDGEPER